MMHRVLIKLGDLYEEWCQGGMKAALHALQIVCFSRSSMLLYSRQGGGAGPNERGLDVVVFTPSELSALVSATESFHGDIDHRNAARGAVAYLMYEEKSPVAIGWVFPESRLLNRLRYEKGCYLGGFYTQETHRNRGYYAYLLEHMCAAGGEGCDYFAETALENVASQKGLGKAGFTLMGRLDRVVVLGCMVRCRLTDVEQLEVYKCMCF